MKSPFFDCVIDKGCCILRQDIVERRSGSMMDEVRRIVAGAFIRAV